MSRLGGYSNRVTVRDTTPKPPDTPPDMYNFADPRKVGPGAWFTMHVNSMDAEGKPEELRLVIRQIENFCEFFKCGECKGHCKEYMKQNPPINVINVPFGLFYWTVEFRNAVNRRLGKPTYDPKKMFDIFSSSDFMVCQEGCGDHTNTNIVNTPSSLPTNVNSISNPQDIRRLGERFPNYFMPAASSVGLRNVGSRY
jgi:hypothetical protein